MGFRKWLLKPVIKKMDKLLLELNQNQTTTTSQIFEILNEFEKPINSTELKNICVDRGVCSPTTFYRHIKILVSSGYTKQLPQGKEVKYVNSLKKALDRAKVPLE